MRMISIGSNGAFAVAFRKNVELGADPNLALPRREATKRSNKAGSGIAQATDEAVDTVLRFSSVGAFVGNDVGPFPTASQGNRLS